MLANLTPRRSSRNPSGRKRSSANDPRRRVLSAEQRRLANDIAVAKVNAQGKGVVSDLWIEALRAIRREGLPEPQGEYMFHSSREWRFDFSWPEFMIAVEVHGKVYQAGRHTRGTGFEEDRRKMNAAQAHYWRVFEFSSGMVRADELTTLLKQVLP